MRFSIAVTLLAALFVLASSSLVQAKGKSKGTSGSFTGTINAIHSHGITFTVDGGTDGKSKKMQATIDDNTVITSGSQKGSIADLAAGQIISIEIKNYKAVKIDVTGVANASN